MLLPGILALGAPHAVRAQEDVPPVIAKFKEKDPGMAKIFADAVGYAVFPTVGKGGIGIGGARGKGWVYQGGKHHRQVDADPGDASGSSSGARRTARSSSSRQPQALENFKLGHLKFDAQASAVALTARASADLAYRNGVAIVTMAKGGLMYEASVGGQKFSFKPVGK